MYDLYVKTLPSQSGDRSLILTRMIELEWSCMAWNTVANGKINVAQHRPIKPISVDSSYFPKLTFGDKPTGIKQLSRVTVVVDDILDAQNLTLGSEGSKLFDIVAASPGNAKVFSYLCKTADIDVISIDFSQKINLGITKKLLDEAIKRGIFFEICYSSLLTNPNLRRDITSGAQILINYLRGRHIILSSGTDNFNLLRAPLDVQNLGKVLRLSNENALNAIRDNPLLLIQRSQARKNRYMSFQVQKSEEMTDMMSSKFWSSVDRNYLQWKHLFPESKQSKDCNNDAGEARKEDEDEDEDEDVIEKDDNICEKSDDDEDNKCSSNNNNSDNGNGKGSGSLEDFTRFDEIGSNEYESKKDESSKNFLQFGGENLQIKKNTDGRENKKRKIDNSNNSWRVETDKKNKNNANKNNRSSTSASHPGLGTKIQPSKTDKEGSSLAHTKHRLLGLLKK